MYLSNNIKILDNIKYLSTLTKISNEEYHDKSHLLSIRLNLNNDINILNFCKYYKDKINKYIFVKDNCDRALNNNIYKIKEQEQEGQEGQGQEEQGNIKYILYLGKATYKEKEKKKKKK